MTSTRRSRAISRSRRVLAAISPPHRCLAPGDLNHVSSQVRLGGRDTAPRIALAYHNMCGRGARQCWIGRDVDTAAWASTAWRSAASREPQGLRLSGMPAIGIVLTPPLIADQGNIAQCADVVRSALARIA